MSNIFLRYIRIQYYSLNYQRNQGKRTACSSTVGLRGIYSIHHNSWQFPEFAQQKQTHLTLHSKTVLVSLISLYLLYWILSICILKYWAFLFLKLKQNLQTKQTCVSMGKIEIGLLLQIKSHCRHQRNQSELKQYFSSHVISFHLFYLSIRYSNHIWQGLVVAILSFSYWVCNIRIWHRFQNFYSMTFISSSFFSLCRFSICQMFLQKQAGRNLDQALFFSFLNIIFLTCRALFSNYLESFFIFQCGGYPDEDYSFLPLELNWIEFGYPNKKKAVAHGLFLYILPYALSLLKFAYPSSINCRSQQHIYVFFPFFRSNPDTSIFLTWGLFLFCDCTSCFKFGQKLSLKGTYRVKEDPLQSQYAHPYKIPSLFHSVYCDSHSQDCQDIISLVSIRLCSMEYQDDGHTNI